MFEITIKEITSVTTIEKGRWGTVDKRPYTQKELDDMNTYFRDKEAQSAIKEVMGYLPETEVTNNVESEVYSQRVESLDLAAVIKAINKIP